MPVSSLRRTFKEKEAMMWRPERLKKIRGYGALSYQRVFVVLASFAMCLAAQLPAMAQEPIRILATGVFATTLHSLAGPFEAARGYKLQISIANAGQVASRIAAGEPADLVMSSSASIKTLAKQGVLAPDEVAIGKMRLGVAVPAGARMPNLTSAEAFRGLLLSAGRISYIDPNGGGTSGPFFERMFASLGIADAVHAKALLGKDGAEIVRAVASGNASIGMTQASEIIGADGVEFGGYIPDSLNLTTPYSASVTARSKNARTATAFLEFIAGPTGSDRLRQAGWSIDR
ncbi:MAG: molybdate ABC transporter substrate-binding protein [Rhodospirillaceae bacterium]